MTILPRGTPIPSRTLDYDGVTFRFGRLTIAFVGADSSVRFSLDESHEPFVLTDNCPADLRVLCRTGAINPRTSPVLFSVAGAWDLRREPDGQEEIVFRGRGGVPVWQLRLDAAFQTAELTQAPVEPPIPVRADGYPLLEFLVARVLGRHGGLLIHASTAIIDDEAYVFVGHTRAGKSTMAGIAEAAGARIPTDDRTILTSDETGIFAWGTPWHGSLVRKSPEGAPVRGIALLRQADYNEVVPLDRSTALKELFVRLIQPRLDASELRQSLETLERVTERVPVATLHFRPTAEAFEVAVDYLRSAVG